jgi:hypothetical protein
MIGELKLRLWGNPWPVPWEQSLERLPSTVRNWRVVFELNEEVCNGGFMQYAANESWSGSPYLVQALEAIGAPRTSALVHEALTVLGSLPIDDWAKRKAAVDAFPAGAREKLDALGDQFYLFEDGDLGQLLDTYVMNNPSDFAPEATP